MYIARSELGKRRCQIRQAEGSTLTRWRDSYMGDTNVYKYTHTLKQAHTYIYTGTQKKTNTHSILKDMTKLFIPFGATAGIHVILIIFRVAPLNQVTFIIFQRHNEFWKLRDSDVPLPTNHLQGAERKWPRPLQQWLRVGGGTCDLWPKRRYGPNSGSALWTSHWYDRASIVSNNNYYDNFIDHTKKHENYYNTINTDKSGNKFDKYDK